MSDVPFTLEYDGESLIINSKLEGRMEVRIGNSSFVVDVKKGRNEIPLSTGNAITFGTLLEVCSENYCKEIGVSVGSDFALYDEDKGVLVARTGLGTVETVPHPSLSTIRILKKLHEMEDVEKVVLGEDSLAISYGYALKIISIKEDKVLKSFDSSESVDVSYCCGRYAVLSDEKVYVVSERGKILSKFSVEPIFARRVGVNDEGVIVCGGGCSLHDFRGKRKWAFRNFQLDVSAVTYSNGHWYLADEEEVAIVRNGNVIKRINVGDTITSMDACSDILAVLTSSGVTVYGIKENPWDPKRLWKRRLNGSALALSSSCTYLAVASDEDVKIFDAKGKHLGDLPRGDTLVSISWFKDKMASASLLNRVEVMITNDMAVNDERFFVTSSQLPEWARNEEYYKFMVDRGVNVEGLELALNLSNKYKITLWELPKSLLALNFSLRGPFGKAFVDIVSKVNSYASVAIKTSQIVKRKLDELKEYSELSNKVLEIVSVLESNIKELLPEERCEVSESIKSAAFSKDLDEFVKKMKDVISKYGMQWRSKLLECAKAEVAKELGIYGAYELLTQYEEVLRAVLGGKERFNPVQVDHVGADIINTTKF